MNKYYHTRYNEMDLPQLLNNWSKAKKEKRLKDLKEIEKEIDKRKEGKKEIDITKAFNINKINKAINKL